MIAVTALFMGGLIQGWQMNALDESGAPVYEFLKVVGNTGFWLRARLAGEVLLLAGHLAFAVNFSWFLVRLVGSKIADILPDWIGPTFGKVPEVS